jgi:hypothetical protein
VKRVLLLIAVLTFTLPLWAEDISQNSGLEEESTKPKNSRVVNSGFELGLAGIRFGFGNNVLGVGKIFTDTLIIDLDKLDGDFKADMGLDVTPLYFRVNRDSNTWGYGLDLARATAYGNLDISGNLLKLKKTDGDEFGVGAAAFVDIGIPVFFHINKFNGFRVKVRPAGYIPVAYMTPDVKYSYKDSNDGSIIVLDYAAKLYTAVSLDPDSDSGLDFSMGADFSAGVEYPLFSWIDLGVDIINIPLIPGSLNQYMLMKGGITFDSGKVKFDGDILEDASQTQDDTGKKYGTDKKYILRPFKMVFYANYRPPDKELITLIPRLGFAINPVYATPASVEAGANARFDLSNWFTSTLGINYEDRMWKNSIDLAFNWRSFGFNIGVSMQSPGFVKSWLLAGFGINFGLKFGW